MRRAARLWALAALAQSLASSPAAASDEVASAREHLRRGELPSVAWPLAARLTLEVDPRVEPFFGRVELDVVLPSATPALWLHSAGLLIERAELVRGAAPPQALAVAQLPGGVLELSARAGRLDAGRATLRLAYRGRAGEREQGLFRRLDGERWYLASQGQAEHARRFVPCFDEPRHKIPWQVTVIAPADVVAFGNAPTARTSRLLDGRLRHELAPTAPLPSYLVALAVGPFEVVELPAAGRAGVPMRLVVPRGRRDAAALAAELAPRAVTAVERFVDLALPGGKLDWLLLPDFFGGMENPGLIVLDAEQALLSPLAERAEVLDHRSALAYLMVHELAHQWFGNSVTPSRWDELWWSEGFATWVTGQTLASVPELDGELARVLSWLTALTAGADPRRALRLWPRPGGGLGRPSSRDLEQLGDAVVYHKGAAAIDALAQWLGQEPLRAALRRLLVARAGGVIDGEDLAIAARSLAPGAAKAVLHQLDHPGVPHVALRLACAGATPTLSVAVGGHLAGLVTPLCVRFADSGGVHRRCELVGARAELSLGGRECPRWISGNDDLRGLYTWEVTLPDEHPRARRPWPPAAEQTRAERLGLAGVRLLGVTGRDEVELAVRALHESAEPADRRAVIERAYYELELFAELERIADDQALPALRSLGTALAARLVAAAPLADAPDAVERYVARRAVEVLAEAPWPAASPSPPPPSSTTSWRLALRARDGAAATQRLLAAIEASPAAARAPLLAALDAVPTAGVPALLAALDRPRGSGVAEPLTWSQAAPALGALLRRRAAQPLVLSGLLARVAAVKAKLAPVELVPVARGLVAACSLGARAQALALIEALGPPQKAEWSKAIAESSRACMERRRAVREALSRALLPASVSR